MLKKQLIDAFYLSAVLLQLKSWKSVNQKAVKAFAPQINPSN